MKIRQLTAEGRRLYARLYAAVLDSGERRVVLSSEGDAAPTTDLLVWAGNNFPVLLDALDEAEEARARAAELEAALSEANAARIRHLDVNGQLRARVAELEAQREPIGYLIVTEAEGRRFVHGDHRQLMTCAEAIESVGRSDLPRGMRHLLCTVQEAD
ncbi:hypothetical protein SAMN05421776_1084 [Nocardia farcinica]|uniref:Uncharacterized protein n=1 Tax=Nocardia farcinica TaxID=37329 RepID=A0A0H5PPQ9_NOCFR|nr:hypothetical protein [Nocardia farcinica]AXK88640.1 hypothetical protein DXT66_26150 [Nocardia farcinica]CRY84416.1 Uncharacterised protein [Nocardia farcinica]CRY84515.1 Uncharacterised protein [Nocardia farcinica]SIT28951.1 hypothetical protein SAMN05421776_1084 [Nocardia farcinica]